MASEAAGETDAASLARPASQLLPPIQGSESTFGKSKIPSIRESLVASEISEKSSISSQETDKAEGAQARSNRGTSLFGGPRHLLLHQSPRLADSSDELDDDQSDEAPTDRALVRAGIREQVGKPRAAKVAYPPIDQAR